MYRDASVTDAEKVKGGFRVEIRGGKSVTARRLNLAMGMKDEMPEIEGLPSLWGTGVLHCPYCHGWELRDNPWAFIATGGQAVERGSELLGWSKDLILCSNGPAGLTDAARRVLEYRVLVPGALAEELLQRLVGVGDGEAVRKWDPGGHRLGALAIAVLDQSAERDATPGGRAGSLRSSRKPAASPSSRRMTSGVSLGV